MSKWKQIISVVLYFAIILGVTTFVTIRCQSYDRPQIGD